MTDSAEPAGDTLTPGSAALQAIMAANPMASAVVSAVSSTKAAVGSTASAAGSLLTDHLANWALIAVGVVLGLGALLISQKSPTATIVEAATSAVRTGAATVA